MVLPLAAAQPIAQPIVFWLCAVLATAAGLLLALLDESAPTKDAGGSSPCSHIGACADSADVLFASLSADGLGLGLLEPLWRVFTPDGALFTLVTLGISGLASSIGSVCAAGARLLRTAGSKDAAAAAEKEEVLQAGAPGHPPHGPDKLKMTFLMELHAYWAYASLFAMGVAREYCLRSLAYLTGHAVACRYVSRERWNSGWVEFYKQHMYKYYVDCFNRPIASAPEATFDVVERTRPGGFIFGVLNEFQFTDKSPVRRCVNLGSYNYLGFGGVDEFCVPEARATALAVGFSAGGPRTEGGTREVHRDLEREVASFLGKEDAIVLGMGFATNSTILPALFEARAGGTGVLVLSDELNHRSIVEGVRLSGATVRAFGHNCMAKLEAALQKAIKEGQPNGAPWRKIFVVVEGIYSMEGDFCRLREIVTLKNRYKAYLYLDEAHSIGAVGPTGRGVSELLGVPTSEIDVMMGTFTKSFGSAGGYVAASRDVINALRRNAPGSVFAAAMSPPCAVQALRALRVISGAAGGSAGAEKLASIRDNANFFRGLLEEEGFKVLGDVDSPIVPLMLHHPGRLAQLSRDLLARGIAVVVVGYPAVPVLYERVRFCLSAAHTREQLADVVRNLVEVGRGVRYERRLDPSVREARAKQAAAYQAWIRSSPLETAASAKNLAGDWKPEPLVPAANAELDACEEAASAAEPRSKLDLRLHDPLGYTQRPLEAAQEAIKSTMAVYGFGACGPRGFYGSMRPHLELEQTIADFLGTEAAILYSAGVATASSVLPALVQPGDRVVVDSAVHLGVKTGLRLAKVPVSWVPHCDVAGFEAAFAKIEAEKSAPKTKKEQTDRQQSRTFVVVEAVCQRTGRVAPLREIFALKEKYGAFLIVDESLSMGVLGAHGRGLFEHCGVDVVRIDAIIGSLEYAASGVGGYCAARKGVVDHQRLAGAGYVFSASCPPAACAAASATIAALASGDGATRRKALRANAARLHEELTAIAGEHSGKVKLISSPESYVQHLSWTGASGEGTAALRAVAASCRAAAGVRLQVCLPSLCTAEGAFGDRIGAPPPPPPTLRLCVSAEHTAEDIGAVAAALREALQGSA